MYDSPNHLSMNVMSAEERLKQAMAHDAASKDMSAYRQQHGRFPWNMDEPFFEQMAAQMAKQGHSPEAIAYALENYQNKYGVNVDNTVQQYRGMGQGAPPVGRGVDTTQYNAGG